MESKTETTQPVKPKRNWAYVDPPPPGYIRPYTDSDDHTMRDIDHATDYAREQRDERAMEGGGE